MNTPEQLDTSTPRPALQKWTRNDQDLWLDFFETYSQILLTAQADAIAQGDRQFLPRTLETAGDLAAEIGAKVADRALQEIQYRFWIQESPKKKRPKKKRAAARRKR